MSYFVPLAVVRLWPVVSVADKGQAVEQVGVKQALCLFVSHPHLLFASSFHLFWVSSFHPSLLCLWQVVPKTLSQQGFTDGG